MKTVAIPARESSCGVNPERLVDDHRDCLFRYALLRVRRPEVAEDLVQETLYAAVRIFGTFRGKSSERTWLCGILKNKICDYFRKLGREVSFTDLELLQDEMSHKFVEGGFWSHDPGRLEWKSEVEVNGDEAST
jgi:RNA polymerase sigma factor (sigma-70 family)